MLNLNQHQHVHFIGIGGIGMSAVARMLLGLGVQVSGSDVRESCLTLAIRNEGASVTIGHSAANTQGADLVVYSTAVSADNIERRAALDQGILTVHRAEVLGALLEGHEHSVGITGTHGKGTTSAIIAWILDQHGWDPGFVIGAIPYNFGRNAQMGSGRVVVAEVDESDGSHLSVHPHHVICNNLELDHLNYYSGLDDIIRTQKRFIESNPNLKTLALNLGDPGIRLLANQLQTPYVGYAARALGPDDLQGLAHPTFVADEITFHNGHTTFWVESLGHRLGQITLTIPGAYNVDNALAALAVTQELGVPFSAAAQAMESFSGLENRFTVVRTGGVTLVKDYLSHPTGMRQVLQAARRLGEGRLWAVYKPYRFTLLKYLGDEYADAFLLADRVVLTDLFTAGETPMEGVDDHYLDRKITAKGKRVDHVPDTGDVPPLLNKSLQQDDVVVFFGGDDFFDMADRFATEFNHQC